MQIVWEIGYHVAIRFYLPDFSTRGTIRQNTFHQPHDRVEFEMSFKPRIIAFCCDVIGKETYDVISNMLWDQIMSCAPGITRLTENPSNSSI